MGKEKGKVETITPSALLLLEYTPITDGNEMNKESFKTLLSSIEYTDFSILNNKSLLIRCKDVANAQGLYKLCKKKLLQISEDNPISPTYIPTYQLKMVNDFAIDCECPGISFVSLEESAIPSLFSLFESYSFSECQDTVFTSFIPHQSPNNHWKDCHQRYSWRKMTDDVKTWLNRSLPSFNTILVKKASPTMSIPIHLDHNLFANSFVACLLSPVSSILHVYNHKERHFFTKPICVSPPARYSDFLTVEVTSSLPCYLLLFTTLQREYHCSCGSEYCMTTLLTSQQTNADYQAKYVDKAYPLLSSYFATSTTKFFKPVLSFISSFRPYSMLLDTGCGDCKYMYHFQNRENNTYSFLGQDNCKDMLLVDKYTKHTEYKLIQSDIGALSLRSGCVDGVLAISVLQHLPNMYRQLQALEELIRVCRKKGRILIYVWSFENKFMKPRLEDCGKDYLLPWKVSMDVLKEMNISFDEEDFEVVENVVEVKRYYFLFMNGELEFLLSYFPSISILKRFFDGQNWCVELEVLLDVCY